MEYEMARTTRSWFGVYVLFVSSREGGNRKENGLIPPFPTRAQ